MTATPTQDPAPRLDELAVAVSLFTDIWADGEIADAVARKLTCFELEALADLLILTGHQDAADTWRREHAEGDDQYDGHNPDGTVRAVESTSEVPC